MKTLSSLAVVFLSVIVITLACFRVPHAVVTEAAASAQAEVAMRQWQSEAAQLYQILDRNEAPALEAELPMDSFAQLASATLAGDSRVTGMSAVSGSVRQAVSLGAPSDGRQADRFDWNTMSQLADHSAEQWQRAADTLAPRQSTRRRSGWAWMIALALGTLSVIGLLVCHRLDPERTLPHSLRETSSESARDADIGIAIPGEWIEIRQSLGFQVRRWGGWALVVTALGCVVRM